MEIIGISITEWVGYLAMATVLISFLMKSVNKLRIINSVGCLFFVIYGFMLQPLSKPIIITNTIIFGINMYYSFLKKN
jgi:uncharacterized protein with PQ loop repeat